VKGVLAKIFGSFMSHSAADGALPTLFAATSPAAAPEGYYGPNGFYELKGPVAPAKVFPQAKDEGVARKLWAVSEQLTGVTWPVEEKSRAVAIGSEKREARRP
jgi:hypothetical protein